MGHQVQREARQGPLPPRSRRIARGLYGGRQAPRHSERRRTATGRRAGSREELSIRSALMVGVPVIDTGPMTVAEFYAFTDTRPDEEKWELIEGEPILNAAPSRLHQRIVKNLILVLGNRERELAASWTVLPGLGVRVSDTDRPEPDVLVTPSNYRSLDP